MTKLLKSPQYDTLSILAMSSLLDRSNLRPAFKIDDIDLLDLADAPFDTPLVVATCLANNNGKELDLFGGYLLGGSVVIKLSTEMGNRLAWVDQQRLRPKSFLLYADVAYSASRETGKDDYSLFKEHRKVLHVTESNLEGKVLLLNKLDYAGKLLAPDVEFSLHSLGIN